ncbi:Pup--protein ligase [Jonesia quinghaiensis]|uniref:Pup--protein ligase n=1 Tax=Jonesia quinghaiensis TaxID=262806 RepID=UPI0004001DC4|nr:Pup--protein ligase [Jonesia quinghaiensis]
MATRRIFGLETEYGITYSHPTDDHHMSADEVARQLFKKVVAWGRSSNVFLRNGSRLYLDVGSHPEYATAECDNVEQLIAHDRGGELILNDLVLDAQQRIAQEGYNGTIHLFKNNTDSAGNSYGCHENYLVRRQGDFGRLADILIPFLITRQVLVGAGKILATPNGPAYCFSQRADHMWEAVSSATTRSRPIINTRDEPHADAEYYRRLHVIVGDSSMSQATTLLKVGATDMVLRLIEAGIPMRDLALDNPMRAIRDVSHDITGRATVTLANGRVLTAWQLQEIYLDKVRQFTAATGEETTIDTQVFDLWERGIHAIETQNPASIDTELDWAIKKKLLDRYQNKLGCTLDDPRLARLDLAYHDISPTTGLVHRLENRGLMRTLVTNNDITHASEHPPTTTRASLRGRFVRAAQDKKKDYTVDWVHLKLNDQAQRTVLCKDPFAAQDPRVDALIDSM